MGRKGEWCVRLRSNQSDPSSKKRQDWAVSCSFLLFFFFYLLISLEEHKRKSQKGSFSLSAGIEKALAG